MFLAEVEDLEAAEAAALELRGAIEYWADCPPSEISHHGRACCDTALQWLTMMDYSQLKAGDPLTGPRWIRARYKWGPTLWPLYWCEALQAKTLDCGALATLSRQAFVGRGLECHTAQLIQRYSQNDCAHWTTNWNRDGAHTLWIRGELVYHEGCAVVKGEDEVRIWDPTAGWWVTPKQFAGYGEVLAVRFVTSSRASSPLTWGPHTLSPNRWQRLKRALSEFA